MRKRNILFASIAMALALSACGSNSEDVDMGVVDSGIVQDTMDTEYIEETSEAMPEIEEPTEATTDGIVEIADIKEEVLDGVMKQAQNGMAQLYYIGDFANLTSDAISPEVLESRNNFLKALGLTESEIEALATQDDVYAYLIDQGFTEDQIYALSVCNYLFDALAKGDDYNVTAETEGDTIVNYEGYLTKTKALMTELGLDFDKLINMPTADDMSVYVSAGSGLTLKQLSEKLWVNSTFPGVNVDTDALESATTPNDFLQVFAEAGYAVQDLEEKSVKTDSATELLNSLKKVEEESKAAEESKSSGSSSGTVTKSDAASTVSSKTESKAASETIPDSGANTITFVVDGGAEGPLTYKGSSSSSSSSSSTNATGTSTISIGDDDYTVKIVVKEIVRGSEAKAYITDSNANLPGEIETSNIPDDFLWTVVKFTVKNEDDDLDEVTRPKVRVKTASGANIEEKTATQVFYIDPVLGADDDDDEKTYYVAFWLPVDQEVFYLYFGDTSGSVYKFKSSAIEDYDKDDYEDEDD